MTGSSTTRGRTEGRALVGSLGVHLLLLALVSTAPAIRVVRATAPEATALIDVDVVDQLSRRREHVREPGGSTMPALPDALPSPVVTAGREATLARAPAHARRRVLIPEQSAEAGEAVALQEEPSSSADPTPDAIVATAPSSAADTSGEGAGDAPGDGTGAGDRAAAIAAAPPPQPALPIDRCGDPVNGVWHARTHFTVGWFDLTLRLERDGAEIVGSMTVHDWSTRSAPCEDGAFDLVWTTGVVGHVARGVYDLGSLRVPREGFHVRCGGPDPFELWLREGFNDITLRLVGPDRATGTQHFGGSEFPITLARVACMEPGAAP